MKRQALGRGLAALLGDAPQGSLPSATNGPPGAVDQQPSTVDYFLCDIERIHPMRDQPRRVFDEAALEELAQSIREIGVLEPLLVRERKEPNGAGADGDGGFWLIAGERRWRAAQRAGLHRVPVLVREASPADAFAMALIENLQRQDLSPIEEAEAYRRLVDEHGYTQEELAARVGKDRSTVANALRLLKLPGTVRDLVQAGKLSMGHARALLGLLPAAGPGSSELRAAGGTREGSPVDDEIEKLARRAAEKGLSVRAVEELVRRVRSGPEGVRGGAAGRTKSAGARDVETRLSRALGARVTVVEESEQRGRLEIAYHSLDELDRLLDRLLS